MQHMASGGCRSLDKGGGGGGWGGHPDPEIRGRGAASKRPLYGSKWSWCRVGSGFLISVYDKKRTQVRFIPFLYWLNSFINLVPCTLEGTLGMGEFHRQFTIWETTWRTFLWITIYRFYERVFYLPCQVPLGSETVSFGPPSKAEQQTLSQ